MVSLMMLALAVVVVASQIAVVGAQIGSLLGAVPAFVLLAVIDRARDVLIGHIARLDGQRPDDESTRVNVAFPPEEGLAGALVAAVDRQPPVVLTVPYAQSYRALTTLTSSRPSCVFARPRRRCGQERPFE